MSNSYGENLKYHFGEFVLDVGRGGLYRGDDQVRIRPRSFDVLRYLLEHPGKLVSRDELIDAVWKGTVVTDDAVTQCLIDIRKAIGDDTQTMIRTVPRRGYVFELPVEAIDADDAAVVPARMESDRRLLILSGVIVLAALLIALLWPREADGPPEVAERPSIAVMPFESMGPEERQTYFADGVSEEIINSLASQQEIKVIARTSSFSFRDENLDVETIADRLGVTHVLEGSVRNDGDALRINVQLVDAATGEYVWTGQFDRALSASSVFAIQSEIATAVVESLQSELTQQERARLVRVPTENIEALDAYFEARHKMETRRAEELDRAADLLRDAIRLDPDFALAYVALAETVRLQANYGSLPHPVANEEGMNATRTALRIDPLLGHAYASLGNYHARAGDPGSAEEAYLRGIDLSPGYAPLYQWYGEFLVNYGRGSEAPAYSRIALALDPRSPIINIDYAEALAGAGRLEDSLAQYDAVLAIDSEFPPALTGKAGVLSLSMGQYAEAVPLLERARVSSPESPSPPTYLAEAYITLGEFELAEQLLEEASRIAPEHGGPVSRRLLLNAVNGDTDRADADAERLVSSWGGYPAAMRQLRDSDLVRQDVEAALDRYQEVVPELFAESPPEVSGWEEGLAIDAAYLLMLVGRTQLAETLLDTTLRHVNKRPRLARGGRGIADVKAHAILGDTDRAIALLKEAVDAGWRNNWQFELELDPALAELRERPEYSEIVDTIRADMERQRKLLHDMRKDTGGHERPASES
jgi:TolB-like protein/DNA-binding winged helix-turn-helix (wHTH) protein/Tfp pilus assembly protein PilF